MAKPIFHFENWLSLTCVQMGQLQSKGNFFLKVRPWISPRTVHLLNRNPKVLLPVNVEEKSFTQSMIK